MRILETDREAAEARVELALGAREELLVSAFIFGDDPFTLTSLGLLRETARRGVRVKLIADAQWNAIPRAVQAHLLAEGVEIRDYHPFRLDRLRWVTRRMHDKLAVADGRTLLAGGRNLQSTYFGFGHQIRAHNYVDCDLLVEGEAAREAQRYFLALWASRDVRPSTARANAPEVAAAAAELDRHLAWLHARIDEARRDPSRTPPVLVESGAVRFLHDPIGDVAGARRVGDELRDLLDGARESVVVESPYLVPTRALRAGLQRALARGVRIRILTNSLGATDNLWPQAGYVGDKAQLVEERRRAVGVRGARVPARQGRGDRRRDGHRRLLQPRPALAAAQQRAGAGGEEPRDRGRPAPPHGPPPRARRSHRRARIPGGRRRALPGRPAQQGLEAAAAAPVRAAGARTAVSAAAPRVRLAANPGA